MSIKIKMDDEYKYFSVRSAQKIGGKVYRPSICYDLTTDLVRTMTALKEQGIAVLYVEKVRFVSGAVATVKTATVTEAAVVTQPSEATIAVESSSSASTDNVVSEGEFNTSTSES
jgi:hypothetical protein